MISLSPGRIPQPDSTCTILACPEANCTSIPIRPCVTRVLCVCCCCCCRVCREIGFLSKLNCYWFFCRYFVFAIVTIVALLASPIILWLDPWVWGFPTIYFLVSANVAVVVYLYFTIFSYVFLLFSVVSAYHQLAVPCR